ncbi:MAG: ribosomal protein S18-alanine N-acetyltransferase [Alphaproteobacteria bacterium]|nr:ribosomal protein S18-alanine N-acetyltransferase [Alphaproteobacteria bacterium]
MSQMLDNLARIHAACFPHKPWTANDFSELKKSGCDIVSSNNGFIVYRIVCDECELISIGVMPDSRRMGLGITMLEIMTRDAMSRGVKKIFLDVAENNDAARKLYTAYGFTEIGRRPKYYTDADAILMEKCI